MMKYKAIIFDMDGTIIDTEHIWKQAVRDVITSRGVVVDDALEQHLQNTLRGLALAKSCLFLKEKFNLSDDVDFLVKEKANRALDLYKKEVRFIAGFPEFHQKLAQHNLLSGIATNADDDTVEAADNTLDLKKFFGQHIYAISAVNNVCKPDPAIYLHAAQQLGVQPHECIAIEDSAHGIHAAKKAGMFCIGINTSDNRAYVEASDLIVNTYAEIDLTRFLD